MSQCGTLKYDFGTLYITFDCFIQDDHEQYSINLLFVQSTLMTEMTKGSLIFKNKSRIIISIAHVTVYSKLRYFVLSFEKRYVKRFYVPKQCVIFPRVLV